MARTQNFSKKQPEVERVHINLSRLRKQGRKFEIVIDPDKADLFRTGAIEDIREVLSAQKIFEDAQKGIFSSEVDLELAFPKMEILDIAEKILREGELQYSAKHREKLQEERRKKIIEIIHVNSINPQNNLPHPVTRIQNAMEEAKVRIDDRRSAEDQVHDILKKLNVILPIRFEQKHLQIHIDEKYAKKYFKDIRKYGKILKEEWLSDGHYLCTVEVPSGLYTDLIDELSRKTHGGVDIKVMSKDDKHMEI